MKQETNLNAADIRGWLEVTQSSAVSTGLAVDEALARAKVAWRQIQAGDVGEVIGLCQPERVDELHALCSLLGQQGVLPTDLPWLAALYESILSAVWAHDGLGERLELSTRLAYLAWRSLRGSRTCVEAEIWEKKTVDAALSHGTVREFLELSMEERSEELNSRFLRDGAVLLACWSGLKAITETAPLRCLEQAVSLFAWVARNQDLFESRDEGQFFAAELALVAAVTSKHCGRYQDCESWLESVHRSCEGVVDSGHIGARAEFIRVAMMHERYQFEEVLRELPEVRSRFDQLGMELYSAKTQFLEAFSLKLLWRDDEALVVLEELKRSQVLQADKRVRAMTFAATAEIEGRRGRLTEALAGIETAQDLLGASCESLASAYLNGVKGELLRDQGRFDAAEQAYRAAIAINSAGGFHSQAAYLRVILAEMLLAAGKEDEATAEIVLALPVIDQNEMVREGIAAMGLLRESVRRKRMDPVALSQLRAQLGPACRKRSI